MSNSKKITLIKLGGSIITNKEIPKTVRADVLKRLVQEIARAQEKTGETYLLGHGQGSFAHAPAMRYKTMDGFISSDSKIGMAITHDSAAQLNRIVVESCLEEDIPAISLPISSMVVTKNRQTQKSWLQVLDHYLQHGIMPVTGGDVMADVEQGCTIWSTEAVFSFLVEKLPEINWQVNRVIHVAEVPGFLDGDENVVPKITPENFEGLKQHLTSTKGFDVTGGMLLKIEESLALAKQGTDSYILSGLKPDTLYNCLVGEQVEATHITK